MDLKNLGPNNLGGIPHQVSLSELGVKCLAETVLIAIASILRPFKTIEAYRAWPEVNSFISYTFLVLFLTFILAEILRGKIKNKAIILLFPVLYAYFIYVLYQYRESILAKFADLGNPFIGDVTTDYIFYICYYVLIVLAGGLLYEKILKKG